MLFYFSANGNTQKLAGIIAEKLPDKAINIEDALRDRAFEYQMENGERLGFAFPVFFGGVPDIMVDFVKQVSVKSGDNYYGYIVVTDGGMSEAAPKQLTDLLLKRGITINGVFGLKTVDTCAFFSNKWFPETWGKLGDQVAVNSAMIAQQIEERTVGEFAQPSLFPRFTSMLMKPVYSILRTTDRFMVSDNCTHCGLCAKNCPTQSIEMQDGIPRWVRKKCMTCMRCLHHCPVAAIDFGDFTQGKPRYTKPL